MSRFFHHFTLIAAVIACVTAVLASCRSGKEAESSAVEQPAPGTGAPVAPDDLVDEASAKWIGSVEMDDTLGGALVLPARYLRKEITLDRKVKSAKLYICGLGLYDVWINGELISSGQVLSPTVSDYTKRSYYNVFDVTSALNKRAPKYAEKGKKAIAVVLGSGRYHMLKGWMTDYGLPRLWLRLDINPGMDNARTIVSDETWKVSVEGPVRADNEYDGETYDARMELDGWTEAGYDDGTWTDALVMDAPGGKLVPQPNPNIAVQDRLTPVSVMKSGDSRYVLDMGQNMVGWLRVKASGIAAGDTLTLRFSETLNPDTTLYVANLRTAKQTDHYVSKGVQAFTWHPEFVYHGFRYVEVTGLAEEPKPEDFEGQVFYDKMDVTGTFECSDPVVNQVYKNAFWGIRGNYRGMPTDCPQRDERMGWFGDRNMGCYGESYVFDNHALYSKWLTDIEDTQLENGSLPDVAPPFWRIYSDNMTWSGALISVADMLYRRFGDAEPVKVHYAAMKKWLDYMREKYCVDGIMTKDRYGDWCMPPESPELIHSKDPARITDGAVLSTAFYYYYLRKMEEFAQIAGRQEDIPVFKAQAEESLKAFNEKYFHADEGFYANNTVTANLLPLYFGMVPEESCQAVFDNIVKKTEVDCGGHVSCGVIGIMFLMRTLTDYGRGDLALKIAASDTYPSWGYMAKSGATTIWELWNGNTADPSMNSGNHVMLLGDLLIWEYEYLGGIRAAEPGYKSIELRPFPIKGLDYVNCSYASAAGRIVSNWTLKDGRFSWHVEVPSGTVATAFIPAAGGARTEKALQPGSYDFTAEL